MRSAVPGEPIWVLLRLMAVKRLVLLVAVVPLLAACGETSGEGQGPLAGSASATAAGSPRTGPVRTGPVEDERSAPSCVEGYSPATLRKRAFAFDGTVAAIGPARTNKPDKGSLPTAAVTFEVKEWFKGGAGGRVTIDVLSPNSGISNDDTPLYEQGTRLLVSGEPRWGGRPLEDAIAWSCGGFTSYYEPGLADEWRAALAPE